MTAAIRRSSHSRTRWWAPERPGTLLGARFGPFLAYIKTTYFYRGGAGLRTPGGALRHWCPFGCCASKAESIERAAELIERTFFTTLPPVPSKNRWTKLYPPLSWFCVLAQFGNLAKHLWDRVHGSSGVHQLERDAAAPAPPDVPDQDPIPDVGVVGLADPANEEAAFREIIRARAEKVSRFLNRPGAPIDLLVQTKLLRGITCSFSLER